MSQENVESTTEDSQENPTKTEEVIEVPWEMTRGVFESRQNLSQTEAHLSSMMLQFEKQKVAMLSQISFLEQELYDSAHALKGEMNISPELTYELKLPTRPEEKAYFLRKDPADTN